MRITPSIFSIDQSGFSLFGVKCVYTLYNENNATLTNTFNSDRAEAMEAYLEGWKQDGSGELWEAYDQARQDSEANSLVQWLERASYASTVFGLQWILEKNRIDDLNEKFGEMRYDILQALDKYCDCTEEWLNYLDENAPEVPEAALYEKVHCCQVFADTIACNIQNHASGEELAKLVNETHLENDIKRMLHLDLKYEEKAREIECHIQDMIKGKIPLTDLAEIASDSCGQAAYAGSLGGSCRTRRQDLGISEHRMRMAGIEAEYRNRSSLNNDVSPIGRQYDMRAIHKHPKDAMQWELLQNQLLQQSLQNANNLAAIKDPILFERVNARLAKCATKLNVRLSAAATRSLNVLNLNNFAQPLINTIGSGVSGLVGADWGSNSQVTQQQQQQPAIVNPIPAFDYKDKPSQAMYDAGYNNSGSSWVGFG